MSTFNKYIGIPWVFGGRDLKGFDCLGLFIYIQREYFNIEFSDIDLFNYSIYNTIQAFNDELQTRNNWKITENPKIGDAVILGTLKNPTHIGIHIECGVLHCIEKMGVVYTKTERLGFNGWKVKGYYSYENS